MSWTIGGGIAGSGAGFALGPLDNLFGSTSGSATESPSTVQPAANKAAAEVVRDAYAVANPAWLASYDGSRLINIRLLYMDNGNTIVLHQVRQGGAWRDNASTTGVEGLPGSGTDFSGVSENHIPAIGAAPDKMPQDSGIDVNPDTLNLRTPGSLTVGSNSILLDDAQAMGSGVENVWFRNLFQSQVFHPAWQLANLDASGRAFNRAWDAPQVTDDVRQAVNTEDLVDPTFQLTADTAPSDGMRIADFQAELSVDSTGFAIQLTTQADERVYKFNFGARSAGVNRFSIMLDPGFIDVRDGDIYNFAVTGATVKGNSLNVPWFTLTFRLWSDKDIARVEDLDPLNASIAALQRSAFSSGRSFINFNDGFTTGDPGRDATTIRDKNMIYTAKNDKAIDSDTAPNVVLPTNAQITADGGFPYPIEFTHVGGTGFSETVNLLRLFNGTTLVQTLFFDQFTIAVKATAEDPWTFSTAAFDAGDFLLSSGVVNIKDTQVSNIANIATELDGVVVIKGDVFVVQTGGQWGPFTGELVIPDNALFMALVDGPSLVNEVTNEDWFLWHSSLVGAKQVALLSNFLQDGIVFEATRNIHAHPANVSEFNSLASGVPVTRQLLTNSQGSNREIRFDNVPLQFSDLVGGALDLLIQIDTVSSSGFALVPIDLEIVYSDAVSFTFPLDTVQLDGGQVRLSIPVPNTDLSSAIGVDASLRFHFNFFGSVFNGTYTIHQLVNSSTGSLHAAVLDIAATQAQAVRSELNQRINNVIGEVDSESQSLEAIADRISPYRNAVLETPELNARFLDSTGSDSFPSDVGSLTQVSTLNPRFTVAGSALFVAVVGGNSLSYVLQNITQKTEVPLESSEATVDLGASSIFEGQSYFIYRVTGLTTGDIFEVDLTSMHQEVAWQEDIALLKAGVNRIDTELEHGLLHLPDAVVNVLETEVAVAEQSVPTVSASPYNMTLSGDGSQAVFSDLQSVVAGVRPSGAINLNSGNDRYRQKLLYVNEVLTSPTTVLTAMAGANATELVTFASGSFLCKQFVPQVPAGTEISTEYISEASGQGQSAGDPIDIVPGTTVNGRTEPEDVAVSLTRNLPTTSLLISVSVDGIINGNNSGTRTFTVPYGGSNDLTYIASDGFNTGVNFRVRYASNNTVLFLEVTNSSTNIAVDLSHFKVLVTYSRTRVVPSVPATTRDVALKSQDLNTSNVFALKASAGGDLVIESDDREVNTGYAFTDIFAADESGEFRASQVTSEFYDYREFNPTAVIIQQLENKSSLPRRGLFTVAYSHETIVALDTQLTVRDSTGTTHNVGGELADLLTRVAALE